MNLDLTNKHAVVCGSTQGIGLASAIEIAELGASVTLVARNEEKLQQAVNQLDASKGQQHRYVVADFSDPNGLKDKVAAHIAANGAAHILVNNTGGPPGGPAIDAATDEFTQAFSNHLVCNHNLVLCVKLVTLIVHLSIKAFYRISLTGIELRLCITLCSVKL